MEQVEARTCTKCGSYKTAENFHAHPKLGLHPRCKPCRAEAQKDYYKNNPEKFINYKLRARNETLEERTKRIAERKAKAPLKRHVVARRAHLKANFGLTTEDYDLMLSKQNGVCAICSADKPSNHRKYFYIDHCHTTNKIRGLLCGSCNTGLGHFKDDINTIIKAAAYLEKHK